MPDTPTATRKKESLDAFFYENQTSNLDNCAKEPVHYIGSVQAEGALLIIDPDSLQVVARSQNASKLLGVDLPEADTFPLADAFPSIAEKIDELPRPIDDGSHSLFDDPWENETGSFQLVYHENAGSGFVEFLPESGLSVQAFRKKLRILRTAFTNIMDAESFESSLQVAVEAAREITGFARVKVYEFQSDWSGKVVAESKTEHMPSYLGLLFPEKDIPKQARYLMAEVPYRSLGNVTDDVSTIEPRLNPATGKPFDLSWSMLRSPSKMHTEYLRNMGVAATFSASLVFDGKLWGLMAFHNDKPGLLPFDLWGTMQDLATCVMAKRAQQISKDKENIVTELRRIEESVAKTIKTNEDLETALEDILPEIRQFLKADGFAFQLGTTVITDGEAPPLSFINQMLDWALSRTDGIDAFASNALHREFPAAKEHIETACGVLIEPVRLHRVCHLIWFRAPVTKKARWAGDPNDKKMRPEADGTETLLPRNSFKTWVHEHRDQSEVWTDAETFAAREILKNMLDIVTSQIRLSQSNKSLEAFSYAAAHDLKSPLRHIQVALEVIENIEKPEDVAEMKKIIRMASGSSERLQGLIDSMMEYLVLEKQTARADKVILSEVIDDVVGLLRQNVDESGAEVTYRDLPVLQSNKELLTTLFMNLIGNSIKFRQPGRHPRIKIYAENSPNAFEIFVQDNGQGISEEYAQSIFEPLKRLHSYDDVEGSGLGLAICKRITEKLNGTIYLDTTYQDGARLVLKLSK